MDTSEAPVAVLAIFGGGSTFCGRNKLYNYSLGAEGQRSTRPQGPSNPRRGVWGVGSTQGWKDLEGGLERGLEGGLEGYSNKLF